MTKAIAIRHTQLHDLAQVTDIYNHYVINSAITFDTRPWSTQARLPWLQQFEENSPYQCLVGEISDKIVGYACSSKLRPKPAYDTSVETTIYLQPESIGMGYGRLLYQHLIDRLQRQTLHRCYGIIALPNPASISLHESMAFRHIGTLTEVGFKFDQYWDTAWMERSLS